MGVSPKALITNLGADILDTFAPVPLIDRYDVYQHLMRYWTEVMQDDVYMIVDEGWGTAGRLRLITSENGERSEKADLTIGRLKYKADLIPPTLIVTRYLANEQNELAALQTEAETLNGKMDELKSILEDLRNELIGTKAAESIDRMMGYFKNIEKYD